MESNDGAIFINCENSSVTDIVVGLSKYRDFPGIFLISFDRPLKFFMCWDFQCFPEKKNKYFETQGRGCRF